MSLGRSRYGATRRVGLRRMAARLFQGLLLLAAGLVLYAYLLGVPVRLGRAILAQASRGDFVVQAERLRLVGLGVALRAPRCYRKGVIGAPGVEADAVRLHFSPLQWLAGYSGVSRIDLTGGVLRPDQLHGPDPHRGRRRPGRPTRARVTVRNSLLHGVTVVQADARLEVSDARVAFSDIAAGLALDRYAGQMSGTVAVSRPSGDVSGALTAVLDPRLLCPVITALDLPYLTRLVNRFGFDGDTPRCAVTFLRRGSGDARSLDLSGEFRLRDCRYRGVEILRADGDVRVELNATNLVVTLHDLFLRRPEGDMHGLLRVTPRDGLLTFDATAMIDPFALARMINIGESFLRRYFVFDGAAKIGGHGVVDYATLERTDFRCDVQTAGMGIGPLHVDEAAFAVSMHGATNTIGEIQASAYEGRISGQIDVVCPPLETKVTAVAYAAALQAHDLNFGVLMESLSKRSALDYKGVLGGGVTLAGEAGAENPWRTISGAGKLRIKDGRVFLLPVFGGLSHLMARIIPGLDFVLRQGDARTEFTIDGGRIHSDHIAIEGDVLSLSARGDYTLPRDIDLEVQARLLKEHTLVAKLLRVLTYPVSKLFEFRVKGPVTEPEWYPINFSGELLSRLGLRRGADEPAPAGDE